MTASPPPRRLFGVDVGGSSIKYGAVELGERPRILDQGVLEGPARVSADEALADLGSRLRAMAVALGWTDVEGVGIGIPGLVHRGERVLKVAPNLASWNGAPVAALLERHTSWPVRLDNDANAFALAEWLWGAGRGTSDAVFLTLGTGIGGGIVAGGRMVRGVPGFAGEPGHTIIDREGIPCPCGSRGCAERYVGIEAVIRTARAHPGLAGDARLRALDAITPRALHEAAEAGSVVARHVWAEVGAALGVLLVNLTNLLNPERIVVGGGIGQAGEWVLDPARAFLTAHSLVAREAPPQVLPAALGAEAGVLGAAGLLLETAEPREG